ncbi:hypothetical protein B9K09_12460 [Pseudomonas sp. M30-35]|nr:hypothetical protein B9K09_12460 [Pseudomonas sp. M30-35]
MSSHTDLSQTTRPLGVSASPAPEVAPLLILPASIAAISLLVTASTSSAASLVPVFLGVIGLSAAYALHRQVMHSVIS